MPRRADFLSEAKVTPERGSGPTVNVKWYGNGEIRVVADNAGPMFVKEMYLTNRDGNGFTLTASPGAEIWLPRQDMRISNQYASPERESDGPRVQVKWYSDGEIRVGVPGGPYQLRELYLTGEERNVIVSMIAVEPRGE